MRQIKFRAWDTEEKRIVDWDELRDTNEFQMGLDNDPIVILEQFTGLLDKDKKDSYDGDKIRTANWGDVVVEWNENTACFGFYYKSKFGKSWVPLYKVVEFEIIGNIHEWQK